MNLQKFLAASLVSIAVVGSGYAGVDRTRIYREVHEPVVIGKETTEAQVESIIKAEKEKPKLSIEKGNSKLKFTGKVKVESYLEKNAYLLNKHIPDQQEYLKETVDLNFGYAYGKKKYGYKAAEVFLNLRHKGVWGKAMSFADKDSGGSVPSGIQLSESYIGKHSHATPRPVIWFREAWLKFSINPMINEDQHLHFFKLGWFPFELGRGIALGTLYGLNKEMLGLYNYSDDKYAPGILLNGTFIKDVLEYDLYYAKFEERGKSLDDTLNTVKMRYIGRRTNPWRGAGKDDFVIAARLKNTNDLKSCGKLDFEPYIMYNDASDQAVEFNPDATTRFGTYGLNAEYAYKDFELGGEVAFNYGEEKLHAIDRNDKTIANRDGILVEQFNKITDLNTAKPAYVTTESKKAALVQGAVNDQDIPGYEGHFKSADDRIRPQYTNKLGGYMGVVDCAYNLKDYNLKFALAYGYASGDADPHQNEVDKTYKGFVGLHEGYMGKRVPSIFILDQRLLNVPYDLQAGKPWTEYYTGLTELAFSNISYLGAGATWSPKCRVKNLSFNPNAICFWRAHRCNKFDTSNSDPTNWKVSNDKASAFMGTELNLIAKCDLLKDLTLTGNFALFAPGTMFKDIKGAPLPGDYFNLIYLQDGDDTIFSDTLKYRISNNTAYHMNFVLEYKF